MKKYAVLHEPGDIVTLAGTRFVVLDVERRGSLPDSLFLLPKPLIPISTPTTPMRSRLHSGQLKTS